ncbi:MAG: hypothetical protein ACI9QC_000073 [Oceanicoccus sp.]|jgi:hypothetical protein
MKRSLQFSLTALILSSLLLSSCGGKADLGQHASDSGLMPEAFIPAEVGLFTSYSLRDDGQYEAIQILEEKLGSEGKFAELFAAQLDAQYETEGITYEDDILPALGDRFRVVFGSRPGTEDVDAFTVVTLADSDKMKTVFDVLVDQEVIEYKKLSSNDSYVNEENDFYAAIHDDLLLVANRPEGLVEMLDLEEEDSLWENEIFQDIMQKVDSDYVFFGGLFPSLMGEELNLPAGFGVSEIPDVIIQQSIVVRAEENGLRFDAYMLADKDAAKDSDISFDIVPKEQPYLISEVPADGLMAYVESYGLEQTFTQANALGDSVEGLDELSAMVQNYFGMDFEEEILSFMDKGFVMSLHQNGNGVIPGLTFMFDVSSDSENAEAFLTKLDGQISGLQIVFDQSLPGVIQRSSIDLMGEKIQLIELDLSAIPQGEGTGPLPASVTSSEVQLLFGVVEDRLIISTASVWGEEGTEMIADSELYLSLKDELGDVDQGLALLAPQGVSEFLESITSLREQLGLANSEEIAGIEELLSGFKGLIAASKTEAYESHFAGYLMID